MQIKMEGRIQKSRKNIFFGIGYQVLYLVLNFITRIIMIHAIGIDSVSLNGLFSEILSVLSLAELGIGSAITYSLYIPLANHDQEKVAKIMNLFRNAYRMISGAIAVLGVLLIPFLPKLITNTEITTNHLILVYLLFLIQTSTSYLFSYKTALLNADQKSYIVSLYTMIARMIFFFINVGLLLCFKNYIIFLIFDIIQTLVLNISLSIKVNHLYPYINSNVVLDRDERIAILANIKHLFIGNLSGKITNSSDNILISVLVGTTFVGYYSQYAMLMNGLLRLFSQVNISISGSIGNLLAIEEKKKCKEVFENLAFVFFVLGLISSCIFLVTVNGFLEIFIGTDFLFEETIVMVIAYNLFIAIFKIPLWTFVQAAGLFRIDKYISIIGSTINLFVSISLGKKYGISGIFVGTVISILIQSILKIILLYRNCFCYNVFKTLRRWMQYLLLSILSLNLCNYIRPFIIIQNPILSLFVSSIITITLCIILICIFFFKTKNFLYWKKFVINMMSKNISVIR